MGASIGCPIVEKTVSLRVFIKGLMSVPMRVGTRLPAKVCMFKGIPTFMWS